MQRREEGNRARPYTSIPSPAHHISSQPLEAIWSMVTSCWWEGSEELVEEQRTGSLVRIWVDTVKKTMDVASR